MQCIWFKVFAVKDLKTVLSNLTLFCLNVCNFSLQSAYNVNYTRNIVLISEWSTVSISRLCGTYGKPNILFFICHKMGALFAWIGSNKDRTMLVFSSFLCNSHMLHMVNKQVHVYLSLVCRTDKFFRVKLLIR